MVMLLHITNCLFIYRSVNVCVDYFSIKKLAIEQCGGKVIGPRLLRQVAASRMSYFMLILNCICCRVSSAHQEQNAF